MIYGSSPPENHDQIYLTFSKNLEKYVRMNSALESVTLIKVDFFLGIFQEFYLQVSEDLFYRTPPCIFVVVVNSLCAVLLRYSNTELC